MNIHEAIAKHPNLLNNYRRAALCLVIADDLANRGDFGRRYQNYIFKAGHYLGTAQGCLFEKYGKTISGMNYTRTLVVDMIRHNGTVSVSATI